MAGGMSGGAGLHLHLVPVLLATGLPRSAALASSLVRLPGASITLPSYGCGPSTTVRLRTNRPSLRLSLLWECAYELPCRLEHEKIFSLTFAAL